MTIISDELNNAIKKEVDRLIASKIEDFKQSDEFYQLLESEVKKMLDNANTFFVAKDQKTLSFCFYPKDTDQNILIDIEKAMDEEDDPHEIAIFLERLEKMTQSLKERIAT